MSIGQFWTYVTVICHLYNMRVTSGPRSVNWNIEVGGVPHSFHLTGMAADIAPITEQEFDDLKIFCDRQNLFAIFEGDHVHLQPKQ